MKHYTVVGICQIYNELEKENLERFVKHVIPAIDALVVYDDGSTDGSYEYMKKITPHVIRGDKNDFQDEIAHRQQMLELALTLNPDYILWLDADEVLTAGAKEKLQELCAFCDRNNYDGINLHELNIWRSATWRRIDSLYNDGWFTRLWKVTPELGFVVDQKGLHQLLVPPSVKRIKNSDLLAVLHYGFATEKNLSYKYLTYKKHGQRGYKMLDRLISEEQLELEAVPKELFPAGLWKKEAAPQKISFPESLAYVESYKEQVTRPKYSIACLIYKSVDWLRFVHEQVLKYTDLDDVEFYFVANDPADEVVEYLENNYLPHYVFRNKPEHKKEWYINNVYRAWNYAAEVARGDFLVFINSDMAFSPGWLEALIHSYTGQNCVASRLVESGKLASGTYGIEKNFGTTVAEYRQAEFLSYAEALQGKSVENGGLFMPLLINRRQFLEVGGYPEGNIVPDSDIWKPTIAAQGAPLISGDVVLMQKLAEKGIIHQTCFNSIVYHFQCGEMDDQNKSSHQGEKVEIAVCNDLVTGTMGERVLWDYLLESLPGAYGVDKRVVGEGGNFEAKARRYIQAEHPQTKVIIQNATFIGSIDPDNYTVAFLQDDLRLMKRESSQQEANLRLANRIVTNSYQTSLSYPDFDCEIIPVGVDADLFKPQDQAKLRQKHGFGKERIGIFVGSFTEVKGWSKVTACFKKYPEITWIAVSKHDESYQAPNVRVFNRVDQQTLAELLNCADFFIIGSPVETQCLAAVEACLCDKPVVMPLVGIFRDFSDQERGQLGIFTDNLIDGVKQLERKHYRPRTVIIDKKLTVAAATARWHKLLESIIQDISVQKYREINGQPTRSKRLRHLSYRLEFLVRKRIFKPIFGKEHLGVRNYTTLAGIKELAYQILVKTRLLGPVKRLLGRE